ncbi:M24 family metallopeptidase [Pseudahrensia aquimaris]|uniref:M24 family metallopeptidase n=1 Tax=Pseudahrensia aquimaris TaxID=744461 RepID=A0ABW3FHM1_9HYPH
MMLHFSEEEFANRRASVQSKMKERSLDALLLFSQESMYWLTGYDTFGYCFFQCLVFKANGDMALLTRSADLRQARHTSNIDTIVLWTDSATANPSQDLKRLMGDMDLLGGRIGVEYDTHGLTAHEGRRLEDAMRSFAKLEDASKLVHGLRIVKSEEEIAHVKKAAKYADLALDAALKTTKAGADEGKILAAMQGAVLEAGGDYPGNPFILGSGEDALLCRYKSGRRKLSKNDQMTIEWAGVSAQYHVAMMRTLIVGKPKAEHEHHFQAAHDALKAVEAAMIPGNTFGDIYKAHADTMDNAGLSRHRLNACGYGLGARYAPCWMDGPMFYSGNPTKVEPNQVLFAHMIIMDSDSETAMCLGHTYLTTEGKPKALSRHGLDFIAL